VKGLVDFTGEDARKEPVAVHRPELDQGPEEAELSNRDCVDAIKDVKCQFCIRKKRKVQATSLCVQCSHFYFCQDCTETHARNKATKNHTVTYLRPVEKEVLAVCTKHDTDLTSYCQTCGTAVCPVCVLFDHGDHIIEEIGDIINAKAEVVKNTLEKQENKLAELQHLKKELTRLKFMAPMVDKQDMLIKEIEDHAQKFIDQIVQWKEDLKKQVKMKFKIIRDISAGWEKVSDTVRELQQTINRARKLLTETENRPVYLDKLISLQKDLDNIAEAGEGIEGKEFRKELCELDRNSHRFNPEEIPTSFGEVGKAPRKFKPVQLFKHTMKVDFKHKFIPCVANLGKKFAVAHPTRR
jgi:hypothetical protein